MRTLAHYHRHFLSAASLVHRYSQRLHDACQRKPSTDCHLPSVPTCLVCFVAGSVRLDWHVSEHFSLSRLLGHTTFLSTRPAALPKFQILHSMRLRYSQIARRHQPYGGQSLAYSANHFEID